jgi:hypothetical protein
MLNIQHLRETSVLNKKWNFGGSLGVASFRELIERGEFDRATVSVRDHARKKRNLEYAKLARPKAEFTLWCAGENRGLDCGKIVFDHWVALGKPVTRDERSGHPTFHLSDAELEKARQKHITPFDPVVKFQDHL